MKKNVNNAKLSIGMVPPELVMDRLFYIENITFSLDIVALKELYYGGFIKKT